MSAAHSRGPAGPVVHRSHSSRLAEREGLGSFGDDCGLSQSSGRPMERDSARRSWSVEWSQETQSVSDSWSVEWSQETQSVSDSSVAADGPATRKDSAGRE